MSPAWVGFSLALTATAARAAEPCPEDLATAAMQDLLSEGLALSRLGLRLELETTGESCVVRLVDIEQGFATQRTLRLSPERDAAVAELVTVASIMLRERLTIAAPAAAPSVRHDGPAQGDEAEPDAAAQHTRLAPPLPAAGGRDDAPIPARRWYGLDVLVTEVVGCGVLGVASFRTSNALWLAAVPLLAPATHVAHRGVAPGVKSLLLRAAGALAGAGAGVALSYVRRGEAPAAYSSGALRGIVGGYAVAAVLDYAFLAWYEPSHVDDVEVGLLLDRGPAPGETGAALTLRISGGSP